MGTGKGRGALTASGSRASLSRIWTALVVLAACGCGTNPPQSPPAPPAAAAPQLPAVDALALARRVRANLDLPYERIDYSIELTDATGASEKRRATFHLAAGLDGKNCAYVVFTEPKSIDGFGLLTLREMAGAPPPGAAAGCGGEPEQFLFVPASKKVSRILYFSTNRRSSFCGTQFTFEDLEPLCVDDFQFRIVGTGVVAGAACYRLESRPRGQFSGYSRIENWVDARTALVWKADYDDPKGARLKTAESAEPFEASPGHYRFRRSTVRNHQSGQATRMEQLEFSTAMPGSPPDPRPVFTLKTLSRGREG
ncbi:MAG: outer membrane lipoprotein-sorting protein [Candidatus Wallbacteria bacterium]|nr:outer membrane lipoprotein-sorting protein [Candidatus Wallbacteria bacterium]